MGSRLASIGIVLAGLAFSRPSDAQDCLILVALDTQGSSTVLCEWYLPSFDVYIVLYVEHAVAGAAYRIQWPPHLLAMPVSYGPSGRGINVPGPAGETIGLGECASGFGHYPVLIAHYVVQVLAVAGPWQTRLGPNTNEHPDYPVYATCGGQILPCTEIYDLTQYCDVHAQSQSIGRIKALFAEL